MYIDKISLFYNDILPANKKIKDFLRLLYYRFDYNSYYKSSDFQLADFSYEFDSSFKKLSIFRFSFFGLKIDELYDIAKFWSISNTVYKKLFKLYSLSKNKKDEFVTYSFTFNDNIDLINIKIYYDTIYAGNIVLNSFTINNSKILEYKKYLSISKLYLTKKFKFIKEKYIPTEFLLRYNEKKELASVKVYYSKYPLNKFKKYLYSNSVLNINYEVGVDYNIFGAINKYNFYIGLYK